MASRQVVYGVGAAATGGILYYLYSAGGDPKLAEKKAECTPLPIRLFHDCRPLTMNR